MAEKLFYSMGEVAEMFDVNLSLIRYWTTKFDILKPKRNNKGNRMFRPEDIANFKMIYHLVKECGMTLEGAQRAMKQRGKSDVARAAELAERLQTVRAMLVEMREMLGSDEGLTVDDDIADSADVAAEPTKAAPVAETANSGGVTVIEPLRPQRRTPDRMENRTVELPFYEQTLF